MGTPLTIRDLKKEEFEALGRLMVEVVLHNTQAMRVAWRLYEQLGSARSEDLDFVQQGCRCSASGFNWRHTRGA